ncbi:MAG: AAA family ATPase, partial [Planctomycetota bacterium]
MTNAKPANQHLALHVDRLRWRCPPETFSFATTEEVEAIRGVVGQDTAVQALRFGLRVNAPGQNIFVRGPTGTGRMTLLKSLLETLHGDMPRAPDRVYVHNFDEPARPRLLTLPRGKGPTLRKAVEDFVDFIRTELRPALASDVMRQRTQAAERETASAMEALGKPFDAELREAGLALVNVQIGSSTRPVIVPLIEGEPASPDQLDARREEGKITEEEVETLKKKITEFSERLQALGEKVQAIQAQGHETVRRILHAELRRILEEEAKPLRKTFQEEKVQAFLDAIVEDVVDKGPAKLEAEPSFTNRYLVNLIQCHEDDGAAPVVIENAPSVQTLVGTIDVTAGKEDDTPLPHMLVRGGAILKADGGFLILDARDLLAESGAWRALIRTLRSGTLEIVPPDLPVPWRIPVVKPEPIPVNLKVILLGNTQIYYLLDGMDADFPHLFKVLADFDSVIERDERALHFYAGALARLVRDERLPPLDRTAVTALCEHGARIAAQPNKLTVRFGRLADITREAAFLASKAGQGIVTADHVGQAVRRTKRRADLPARRFRERIADGTIQIATSGAAVGQINGLAVIQAGPLTYGFPQRITATIGPGTAGAINIEREAQLSGAIHNKGFYILGGLLRYLLRTDHPLAFDASVAFEQSYGGIDGDSASSAEMCCLLSALTDLPLRQDLAMTGAIDQVGNILPIGAVNEKIDGFYDTCNDAGLTGTQGVIIPRHNVGDLMLRADVVEACREGRFRVYAVG